MKNLPLLLLILTNIAICSYLWGVWAGILNAGAYAIAYWAVTEDRNGTK